MAVSANRLELLQIADAVAREKSIDRMIVIEAMEEAIQRAAKARYGAETEVKPRSIPALASCACGACSKLSSVSKNMAGRFRSRKRLPRTTPPSSAIT